MIIADNVLFCVHNEDEKSECRRLRTIPPLNAQCAEGQDPTTCLEFSCVIAADCRVEIRENRADVMMASALGLWYLNQDWKDMYAPVVAENRGLTHLDLGQDGLTYKAVAIATEEMCKKGTVNGPLTLANSQGLSSCHGEYGSLPGWVAVVAKMKKAGLSKGATDIDMVTNWFEKSCAPSNSEFGLCSACTEADDCDLDDPYATPLGVVQCLRENAAQIGFLDHWTAWGAGQQDGSADGNATALPGMQVVCQGGCKELADAVEADCYLAKVPSDVAIMRASDTRLEIVRHRLVKASNTKQFRETFGTSSNLNGALFSHGTSKLEPVSDSTPDYLGGLDATLTQFAGLFKESTDLPQPDADGSGLAKQVQAHPSWAVGITFLGALVLGMLVGLGLTTLICRRRMRAARRHGQLEKDMDVGEAAINPSGRNTARFDHPTYVDES